MLKSSGLVCGLFLAAGAIAHAQDAPATGGNEVRRVSQILGSTVQLQGVNNFGKVEDIILNDGGGMAYLVVSANGKYAMLPWNAGNVDYAQRVVAYDVAPQAVQPFYFERNAYPNVNAPQFTNRIQQAFPAAAAAATGIRAAGRPVQPGAPIVEEREKSRTRLNGTTVTKDRVTVPGGQPGQPALEQTEKIKEKPNGQIIIKDKEKVRDR